MRSESASALMAATRASVSAAAAAIVALFARPCHLEVEVPQHTKQRARHAHMQANTVGYHQDAGGGRGWRGWRGWRRR